MTLTEIKDIIIETTKKVEICDSLHDAQIATTEDDLIAAGLPLVVWVYLNGIVDDTLLAEFDEAKLNAAGIYTNGTFSLTNPANEVYILKTAVVAITVDGNNKAKINVMGDSAVEIIAGDNAYLTIKVYNTSDLDLTVNGNAIVSLESKDTSALDIIQNNDSILHIFGADYSTIDLVSNNQSYTHTKMYNSSVLTYELFDTAAIDAQKFQSAIITDNTLD